MSALVGKLPVNDAAWCGPSADVDPTGLRRSADCGQLSAKLSDLVLQLDNPLGSDQGHAFAHQRSKCRDVAELDTAVTPLPPYRTGRAHDTFRVESTDKGGLHVEHRGGLTDGEERGDVIGDGDESMGSARARRRRPARTAHDTPAPTGSCDAFCELASIEVDWPPPTAMSTRRGLACSLTGTRSRSTPSV